MFNVAFGVVSATEPALLIDGSPLARRVSAFIAAYWAAHIAVQFLYFDRTEVAARAATRFAETALVALFVSLSGLYAAAALWGGR